MYVRDKGYIYQKIFLVLQPIAISRMESIPTFFHPFRQDVSLLDKPTRFTFPFCYEPHPLSIAASEELQSYLQEQTDFEHNFGLSAHSSENAIGKMFGVLVVEDQEGRMGYLAACSGKLAGSNCHPYFVPPVFDMLEENGFFLKEEKDINRLNREIEMAENDMQIEDLELRLKQMKAYHGEQLASLRILHKTNKAWRKQVRSEQQQKLPAEEYKNLEQDLIKQSYRDQHEYDVQKQACRQEVSELEQALHSILARIGEKKELRKQQSAKLQHKLFDQYQFLNARGEVKSVRSIFEEATKMLPPAGAGECAAPKLLQYAYQQHLKPICMAEFWWGLSPASEVRKHRYYYPSCRGKCEPILGHMLQGLLMDDNPMLQNPADGKDMEIIFEDEDIIVVNKPTEFLSVPGIQVQDSVQTRILSKYPNITGPLIIHRLDMSTSGILVLAKNKNAHQFVQDQFIRHTVEKRYTALLDGLILSPEGVIDIPLRVDLEDRPRQVVCEVYGKAARTRFRVVQIENDRTRIHYFPLTGRTHQLRVHSAHHRGLNTPIVGDDLYGKRADRLYLHAGYIKFVHPRTKQKISFEVMDPF